MSVPLAPGMGVAVEEEEEEEDLFVFNVVS
jgi:hypothetical protein